MGKIVKKVKKIIPKEIKPALPYIAAYYGGPLLAKQFTMNPAFAKFLTASATSKLQGDDTSTALRSGIFSAAPDVISSGLQKTAGYLDPKLAADMANLVDEAGSIKAATGNTAKVASALSNLGQTIEGAGALKTIGAQTSVDVGARTADLNEKALRDYEAQLREQGIMDSAERRNKIFGYFSRAGYDDSEINSMLDKYGYATGGVVAARRGLVNRPGGYAGDRKMAAQEYAEELAQDKYGKDFYDLPMTVQMDLYQMALDFVDEGMADGGKVKKKNEGILAKMTLEEFINDYYIPRETKAADGGIIPKRGLVDEPGGYAGDVGKTLVFRDLMKTGKYTPEEAMKLAKELDEEDFDSNKFSSGLQGIMSGFEMASGQPLTGLKPQPTRFGLAEGGILNTGGKEMDMRGGGFIPIGSRERADDVPARLSKNEFVMTADAVRSAGGGSINKGAKRMYDLMNRLEAKA